MKTLNDITIDTTLNTAVQTAKDRIQKIFDIDSFILFGSVARAEGDTESDVDLLIITKKPLSRNERHMITDIVFDINLSMETNLSTTVLDTESWESGVYSVLPFRDEILNDGIKI